MKLLEGKVALVTGASRGIGRAIALDLAAHGADVVVNYANRLDAAETACAAIRDMGRRALALQADVAEAEEVARMVAQAVETFGHIDILINNATLHRGRRVEKLPEADWNAVIDSCLKGAYHCCQHLVPQMRARGGGRIINISSSVGLIGWPGDTAYGAAKSGLIGFTRSLAKEVAPDGITANIVMPGYIRTDMTAALTPKNIEHMLSLIPMGRAGEPEDVAEVVTFLAAAGAYVTGAVYVVDGGMSL
ncbi:MAG: 3-ketoacyl-ACP reductase [Candidatus Entotheonella factor]|uniref:3-ketoacyl-ACP reductase n=1 Tax=Entotheonella factor TaxID=1429438 RepID=W4LWE2_ENTF1|nr:3-oxoacyl-ACP reductase family protein [Candidatus Entotheonella palauensis]ETX02220.1 MAG: 3-ketoacyl-ACP reductase [Candidatus Entotheonella factor]